MTFDNTTMTQINIKLRAHSDKFTRTSVNTETLLNSCYLFLLIYIKTLIS